ncbi:MAG: magnesium-translocating P-type ATPase [Candidatus Acidiferrum sp.]
MGESQSIRLDSATTQEPTGAPPASKGLTQSEADKRLRQIGPNDPSPRRRGALLWELLLLFLNPLVIILFVAILISIAVGLVTDAAIIFVIAMLSVVINFIQTYRSERSVRKLREHVSLTASVFRDGKWQEVRRENVVPGDLVRLSAGDLVPADGFLVESRDLYIQQAALTGESMPVEKETVAGQATGEPSPESSNWVFLGTSVVSGTAIVRVTATGSRTSFGFIGAKLRERTGETEFERGLRQFGMLIMRAVLFLVLFILVVRVALHKDAFESFVFAVALAVGLTPEFLPMITSVTLGRGAVRMARKQVIVKHLPAIQNFGSIDILCSDKTGTLTTGVMTLHSAVDAFGLDSERPLLLARLNSKFETGIRSPLDAAILQDAPGESHEYVKCDEVPFDFNRRRLSVVVERCDAPGSPRLMITKGAPEGIIALCDAYEREGQMPVLDPAGREQARKVYEKLCEKGFRVLAVAWRHVDGHDGFCAADERSLVLAGFLAFEDPARSDANHALAQMKRDGIEVKILTGDNELVARHVCMQVGLVAPTIVLGPEVDGMTEPALWHVAEQTTVFARVTPMQKLRILRALRQRGHVVGYIGDGINDAPSLHAADVGISVATAVDVARDAADIILLRPGLAILHRGIIEGRKASGNVLKYLLMDTSSNFGNMFSMAGASLFLPYLPMLSTQILLNNFLYDSAQIAIPTDNVDEEYLRGPQRWDMRLIRNFMIFVGPISSLYDFLTFYVLLHFFRASEVLFHTGWFVESLATQTLVLFVIRTAGNPLKSRPSRWLTLNTLIVVAVGLALPWSPLAGLLGFTPLPVPFFLFLGLSTITYLLLVEAAKRKFFAFSRRQEKNPPEAAA